MRHAIALLIMVWILAGTATADTLPLPDRWLFTASDQPGYSDPAFDDHAWSPMWVPSQLADEGYELPDGMAWYRVHFDVDDRWVGQSVWLVLGKIDAADETYVNGVRVGGMGKFPPKPETAWSETRFYRLPAGTLQKTNVLAVRVSHAGTLGGITDGPISLYDEAGYQAEFHPPPGPRATLHQLVTSNGLIAAVYDAHNDFIKLVLPHIFRAVDNEHAVKGVIRHLAPDVRPLGQMLSVRPGKPASVGYEDNSHVIRVAYSDGTVVRYFAPFTTGERTLYAVVSGPRAAQWNFKWDAGAGALSSSWTSFDSGVRYFRLALSASPSKVHPTLLRDELAYMRRVRARCHIPSSLRPEERKALEQAITVLKMAQVSDKESLPLARGQIVACLPPGAWNVTWVRDGVYSTLALNRLGLYDEARRMLEFELRAQSGLYAHFNDAKGRDVGIGVPYRISVCRYFGCGREEAFGYDAVNRNIEIDGFGLFLIAFSDYVERSGDHAFYQHYAPLVSKQVADVILHCTAANGLIRPESGPWERYLDFKQFACTSIACSVGLRAFAGLHPPDAKRYADAARAMETAIRQQLVTRDGWIKGNAEASEGSAYDTYDGGTFEAFALGLLSDTTLFQSQLAAYDKELRIPTPGRGFARINNGDSYETAEWVLMDLRVASCMARLGDMTGARRLADWVTAQAALNYNLIPEMYRRDNAAYDGAIPMVGFGAGAYVLTELDLHPL